MATDVNFGVQQYFGFDPRSLPNCVLWIDALDSNTVTLSGSSVTAVKDKSSNAYTFSNATGFTYNVTKFNTNYPSFYTAANVAGNHVGSNTSFSLSQPASYFVVCQLLDTANGGYMFDSTNSGNRMAFIAYGGGKPVAFAGVELSNTVTTTFTSAGQHGGVFNSTSSLVFSNGTQTISGDAGTQGATGLILGSRFSLNGAWGGHLCEILMYSRTLTTPERQQVEGYLGWKWGISSNLPSGHPYLYSPTYSRLFQPPDIDGNILWLDSADQGSNSMTLSGTTISTWLDKSGNGSNFTSQLSPTIGTLSNLPIVDTTGGGCFTNGSSSVPTTYSGFTTGYSTITNTWSGLFYGTPDAIFMLRAYLGQMFLWKGNGSVWGNPSVATGPSSTTNSIWSFTNPTAAGPSYLWVNGTLNQSNTGTTNYGTSGLDIGRWVNNSYPWRGYIGDVIFYDSGLSDPERQRVEGYLAWKMGLRASLPSTHPFYNFPPSTAAFHPMLLSNSTLWLDGADSTSNSMTFSGANITVWKDKSSNGKNFTASGTGATLGSNGGLVFTTNLYTSTHSAAVTNETIFLVCQYTNTGQGVMIGSSARSGREVSIYSTNNQVGIINALNAWGALTPAGSVSTSNTFLTTGIISGGSNTQIAIKGSSTFYSSNVTPYTFSNGNTQLGQEGGGGTTYQFAGTINEIIAYSRVLSSNERRKVEGYLTWKWGIRRDMSGNHPFYGFRP